jgi:general secretion pathway protein J
MRRPAASPPPSGDRGFTLVELLVGLSLMSLLAVTLIGAMRTGLITWRGVARHAEKLDQIMVAQSQLRKLIGAAYPMHIRSNDSMGHVVFDGTSTSLRFLSTAPVAVQGGGRGIFLLSVVPRGNGFALTVTSRPELEARSHKGQPASVTLVEGLEYMSFAYFGRRRDDRVSAWHDNWQAHVELPLLVRIDARFAGHSSQRWPSFVVRPQISVDISCELDVLIKRCRGR